MLSKTLILISFFKNICIIFICNHYVQKALNNIEFLNNIDVFYQIFANGISYGNWVSFDDFQQRKNHHGDVTFKIFSSGLKLYFIYLLFKIRLNSFLYFGC